MFQQDGAPSHTSRVTQAHLEEATSEFIEKNEWFSQSPECNPMDYGIWDSLKVYLGVQDKSTEQALMNRMIISWEEIICKCNFARKKRLCLVLEEDGGHTEHRLK